MYEQIYQCKSFEMHMQKLQQQRHLCEEKQCEVVHVAAKGLVIKNNLYLLARALDAPDA
jgi:hypothetical protein